MTLLNKFATYIGTRTGRTSAVIVALTGAILAIFICLTFVDPAAPTYRIDFKDARWIQMPEATKWDAAYFRKTLYVSGSVVRGWIAISATGNYSIFVNGILVAQDEFPAVRPTGIIDIKKILSPGKNVIGVYVAPGSYPGPPQILVQGNYQVASSPATEIDSDSSWKVAATPDGVVQSYSWRSPELDDRLWTDAVETSSGERFSTVQPIPVEPRIFDSPSNAKWITARHGDRRQMSFSSTLDIPRGLTRTWIQIAASGAYDVVINGRLAVSQPLAAQATVGTTMLSASAASRVTVGAATVPATTIPGVGPTGATPAAILRQESLDENHTDAVTSANSVLPGSGTPAAINDMATRGIIEGPDLLSAQDIAKASAAADEGGAGEYNDAFDITPAEAVPSPQPESLPLFLGVTNAAPVLLAYDISQWLKGGINSIAISVRSVNGPALLLAQGFTVSGGRLVASFRTDGSWKVSSYSEAARARFGAQEPAAIGGAEEDSPWGPLPQAVAYPQNPPGQDYYCAKQWAGTIIATIILAELLWFCCPLLTLGLKGTEPQQIWTSDALWHLMLLAVLLILGLSTFDVRLAPQWCFIPAVIWSATGFLIFGKAVVAIASSRTPTPRASIRFMAPPRYRWPAVVLIAIVLAGLAVRASGLLEVSFSHDEAKMAQCSLGVLKVGFPYFQLGSFTRWLTTYELVPYPLALCSLIFGHTVFAYRLPALVFGTLTIGLIGLVGYRMMGWRVGLTAAFIYTFLPVPIGWSQDGFYPSQESFFSLLTFWCFFESLRTHPLHRRYLTLTSIAFMLTYLSWEGAGFILPTLFVVIVVVRWGDFDWVKDLHLWRCLLIVSALVITQLSVRQILLVPDYLGIVYDLSEITTPALVFLSRLMFDPLYYIKAFFLAENQVLLSVLALAGLLFFRKNKALLYICTSLFTLELCYTCLLPKYAPRYDFQTTTLLVLAGTGVLIKFCDLIRHLCRRVPAWTAGLGLTAASALFITLVLAANPFVSNLYRLSSDPANPAYFGRLGVQFKPDYRDVHEYVARMVNPGDTTVSRQAHVFAFFTHKPPDYSPDAVFNARMYYDGGFAIPRYIDKSWGVTSLRSLREIEDLRANHSRVWLVVAKGCRPGPFLPDSRSPQTPPNSAASAMLDFDGEDFSYLESAGKVMRETNCQELIVLPGVPESKVARRKARGLLPVADRSRESK